MHPGEGGSSALHAPQSTRAREGKNRRGPWIPRPTCAAVPHRLRFLWGPPGSVWLSSAACCSIALWVLPFPSRSPGGGIGRQMRAIADRVGYRSGRLGWRCGGLRGRSGGLGRRRGGSRSASRGGRPGRRAHRCAGERGWVSGMHNTVAHGSPRWPPSLDPFLQIFLPNT